MAEGAVASEVLREVATVVGEATVVSADMVIVGVVMAVIAAAVIVVDSMEAILMPGTEVDSGVELKKKGAVVSGIVHLLPTFDVLSSIL